MRNDTNPSQTPTTGDVSKKRAGMALRGALAGATATAVLLGGFGAFALWEDNQNLGLTANLQTGRLEIVDVSLDGSWEFAGDIDGEHDGLVGVGAPIDPAVFRVSPGDVLEWTGTIDVVAQGTDMLARVAVDSSQIVVHPDLAGMVTVTAGVVAVDGVAAPAGLIEGDDAGAAREVEVAVQVAFSRDFGENADNASRLPNAVVLDNLELSLVQVTG